MKHIKAHTSPLNRNLDCCIFLWNWWIEIFAWTAEISEQRYVYTYCLLKYSTYPHIQFDHQIMHFLRMKSVKISAYVIIYNYVFQNQSLRFLQWRSELFRRKWKHENINFPPWWIQCACTCTFVQCTLSTDNNCPFCYDTMRFQWIFRKCVHFFLIALVEMPWQSVMSKWTVTKLSVLLFYNILSFFIHFQFPHIPQTPAV